MGFQTVPPGRPLMLRAVYPANSAPTPQHALHYLLTHLVRPTQYSGRTVLASAAELGGFGGSGDVVAGGVGGYNPGL